MLTVTEHNDIAILPSLHGDWNLLLSQTPEADFFRTSDWLEVYWKHFGAGQKLRLLTVADGSQIVGIVPFTVQKHATRLGAFRKLTFPLDYWGTFYGPIGPDPATLFYTAIDYIAETNRDWDFLDLNWIDQSSECGEYAEEALRQHDMPPVRQAHTFSPIVELGPSWDEYFAGRSGNWRSNCRRNEKKLAKQGHVKHVRYRPQGGQFGEAEPRWALYDHCEHIASESWQGSSQDGTTITHESVRSFLRDVHAAAARAGCLDMNLLLLDERPIAFNYNYIYRGHASSLRLGFLPEFRNFGAGTVLTYHMLRDSCERGDHLVDFLPGSLEVKRPWQTSMAVGDRYRYVPSGFSRVGLFRAGQWIAERVGTDRTTEN